MTMLTAPAEQQQERHLGKNKKKKKKNKKPMLVLGCQMPWGASKEVPKEPKLAEKKRGHMPSASI